LNKKNREEKIVLFEAAHYFTTSSYYFFSRSLLMAIIIFSLVNNHHMIRNTFSHFNSFARSLACLASSLTLDSLPRHTFTHTESNEKNDWEIMDLWQQQQATEKKLF
jgi:hypothetical protein